MCSYSQTLLHKEWCTYYFGRNSSANTIIIDSNDDVVVAGNVGGTSGMTLPLLEPLSYFDSFTTPNVHKNSILTNKTECFLAKFNKHGALLWSTYYGGENGDSCIIMNIDANDNIYVSGSTHSATGIATANALYPSYDLINISGNPKTVAYLIKFSTSGQLLWDTYLPCGRSS